jgi:hypothetical protein
MSKAEKLLEKARRNPDSISFPELESLAEAYGLPLTPPRGGGSHYTQKLPDGTKNTIPRDGNQVKKWYVIDVVDAILTFGKKK